MTEIKPLKYLIYNVRTKHLTGINGRILTDYKMKMGVFKRYEHTMMI